MKSLITGWPGFIPPSPEIYFLQGRDEATGIDCFTDYYSKAEWSLVHENYE